MSEQRDAWGKTLLIGITLIVIFGWLLWALAEGHFLSVVKAAHLY